MSVADALDRITKKAVAIGAGATVTQDLDVSSYSTMVVNVRMTAGVQADLGVTVVPYIADDTTVSLAVMPAVSSGGPTYAGGKDCFFAHYDVTGIDRLQVQVKNNNAGAQTIEVLSIRLA